MAAIPVILFFLFIFGLVITSFVIWIIALVDVVRREFPDSATKVLWVVVILFAHFVGAIIYMIAGRKQGYLPGERRA